MTPSIAPPRERALLGTAALVAMCGIVFGAAGCAGGDGEPPVVAALRQAGLPAGSLDAVPIDGAPRRGADRPLVSVVAFVDPVDRPSRSALATLTEWVDGASDVALAVRLVARADHPGSAPAAARLAAVDAAGFFDAWAELDPTATATATPTGSATPRGEAALAFDAAEASRLRIAATPTVFINGFRLTGSQPVESYEALATAFREALAPIGGEVRATGIEALLKPHARRKAPAPRRKGVLRRDLRPVADSPRRGAKYPKVTIVFFADLECSHARAAWQDLQKILRDNDDVQVRFRHRPLASHPRAHAEALAAVAASLQNKFWPMVDRLFRTERPTEAKIRSIARSLQLDLRRFDADRRNTDVHDKLDADRRDAERLRVDGVPVLVINGVSMAGHPPRVLVEDRVAAERARADRLLEEGVKPTVLQVETVRRGAGDRVETAPRRPPPGSDSRRDGRDASKRDRRIEVFIDPTCAYCAAPLRRVRRAAAAVGDKVELRLRPRSVPFARRAAVLVAAAALTDGPGPDAVVDEFLARAGRFDGRQLEVVRARLAPASAVLRRAEARVDRDVRRAWTLGVTEVPAIAVDGHVLAWDIAIPRIRASGAKSLPK